MSERLTKKDYMDWSNGTGYYNQKQAMKITEMEHKLGDLEDIMEKYGIESIEQLQDLLKFLNGYFINTANALKIKFENFEDNIKYLANRNASQYDELYDTKISRDTWKKACELACEVISYNMTPYAMIKSLEQYEVVAHKYKDEVEENTIYLYQQAKESVNEDTKDI